MADKKTKSKKDNLFPSLRSLVAPATIAPPEDEEMVRDLVGFCYALPPQMLYDGEDIVDVRPVVFWQDMACRLFRPRIHS